MKSKDLTDNPLISVVTVVFNGAKNIEKTIVSVLNQNYKNVEYIIIDGGSTDGTIEIIKKHEPKIKYWTSKPDKGIYDAMNKAIDIATGEWINFMNCGDRFASDEVLNLFTIKQNADLLYGNAIIEYAEFNAPFKKYSLDKMWNRSPFCHQACFVRTSLMKQYKFNLEYKIGADHDLFFRAYKENRKFLDLDVLICYFDGTEGATEKGIITAIQDKKNIALKYENGIDKWFYYQFYLMYVRLTLTAKHLLGARLTGKIKQVLKK